MTARLENDDGKPTCVCDVGGRAYRLSLAGVTEDRWAYFVQTLGAYLEETHRRATAEATRKTQRRIQDALGLND